jgi:selenide,water dikinase
MPETPSKVRLTEFSHGAGCGCKISPSLLTDILDSRLTLEKDERLLVGNDTRDDAAVYDLGDGRGVISTTDFFMPIVDDPFDFGRIAVTNAISDVYAMGGYPLLAIAVLGWPTDKLDAATASAVVDGGRQACADAGIRLAGGHSIDSPEPIFGAAVTGEVKLTNLKRNDTARPGDLLFLTKPLGIGLLTTAEKKRMLCDEHVGVACDWMCQPNRVGAALGEVNAVSAMTDVTGFGLAGHLLEICQGSNVRARLNIDNIPVIDGVHQYIQNDCIPGGSERNFASYGEHMQPTSDTDRAILCDPQTSGGLLVAVSSKELDEFERCVNDEGLALNCIGEILPAGPGPALLVTQ